MNGGKSAILRRGTRGRDTAADAGVPRISDAEWTVMRVVWGGGRMTANRVVELLDGQADWKPKTIHTLLRRLVQKGALGFSKTGREYEYFPLIGAQDCERAASRSFLRRVFGGRLVPLLACFLEQESLTEREIDELKRMLKAGRK